MFSLTSIFGWITTAVGSTVFKEEVDDYNELAGTNFYFPKNFYFLSCRSCYE